LGIGGALLTIAAAGAAMALGAPAAERWQTARAGQQLATFLIPALAPKEE